MINPFFQNKGPLKLDKILDSIKTKNNFENIDTEVIDIKDLVTASANDITFFHSKKYELVASTTKASYCLTTKKLSSILPKKCIPIEVDNVLVTTAMITSMFYPDAITDDFDIHTLDIEKTSFKDINNIFFDEFFTLLIVVDVILLLASFYYTDKFHKVIRNSGFIISTILIRLSFSVTGLLNIGLIIGAIVFGLLILMIHNKFEEELS